jgi:predicted ester cyclase
MGQKLIIPKLIVGFDLDTDKVKAWMEEHKIDNPSKINEYIQEKFPEIPRNSPDWSIYISYYGNRISNEVYYYLRFNNHQSFKIKDISITTEMLSTAKKVIKELTNEEIDCPTIQDIPIFSRWYLLYEWQ